MTLSDRFHRHLRRITGLAFAAVGALAIINVETVDTPVEGPTSLHRAPPADAPHRRAGSVAKVGAGPVGEVGKASDLRAALGAVEIDQANPFAELRDPKALAAVFAKGVTRFTRVSYRSAQFQNESGYDIVSFDVTHKDQTRSTLLAYLERPLGQTSAVPVVLIATFGPTQARRTLFREGALTEEGDVAPAVAQTAVAQRLNQGVPFLSVSR